MQVLFFFFSLFLIRPMVKFCLSILQNEGQKDFTKNPGAQAGVSAYKIQEIDVGLVFKSGSSVVVFSLKSVNRR